MKVTDMPKTDAAGAVLETALKLVTGAREEQHGDKVEDFNRIAMFWQAYLAGRDLMLNPLKASDIGNMMELLKVARRGTGSHNLDDYIDGAGYAACAAECAEREEVDAARIGSAANNLGGLSITNTTTPVTVKSRLKPATPVTKA